MALLPPSRSGLLRPVCAVALGALAIGCADNNLAGGSNSASLDSIAARGDSMIARAARIKEVSVDSLRLAIEAEMARSGAVLTTGSSAGEIAPVATDLSVARVAGAGIAAQGAEMTRRAQARGDSMARVAAARFASADAATRSRGDSVRGTVTYLGSGASRQLAVEDGSVKIAISGMATSDMSSLEGKEVVVRGLRTTPRSMVVSDFIVRSADGMPVLDGILDADGVLRLSDGSGSRRLNLTDSLRSLSGTRIWVSVKDGQALRFGPVGIR